MEELTMTLDRMTSRATTRCFQAGGPWRAPRHRSAFRWAATRMRYFASRFPFVTGAAITVYFGAYFLCVRTVYLQIINYDLPLPSYFCGPFDYFSVSTFFQAAHDFDKSVLRPKRWKSEFMFTSTRTYTNQDLRIVR